MNIKHKNLIIFTFLLIILSFTLAGCSKNELIVEIDGTKLYMDDFLYDIYLIELEGELWNSNYKESLDIDYWEYENEGITMEQLAKDTIMTRVVLYNILSNQAKKEGYFLDEDELTVSEENVDKLIASMTTEELKETGMDRDILIKAFNKLALGDKYYLAITDDFEVDKEAIKNTLNPDEYREYITECLYVPTAEVDYQEITPYDEDKLENAYEKILEIKDLIINGADFDEVLAQLDGATHYNRSFILGDNTAEEEYKAAAKKLDKGAYSDVITTQFGHYIIHMLDNNSSTRYEEAIENAIMDEKTNQFRIYYDELLVDYEITINSEYWDSLKLGTITSKGN